MPSPAPAPIHLKPAAELAERVLLPGDPHRALAVAQALLDTPRMFNHQRGLWGYSGLASDGLPLTVQATGMGGPSAALVAHELIELGARTLIRIGTCGALVPQLRLGDLLVAVEVIPCDGASAALGAAATIRPDAGLSAALLEPIGGHAAVRPGRVVSTDLFYDDRRQVAERWLDQGAVAVEMEAAALLQLASRRGVRAGCLLAVSDLLGPVAGGGRSRTRMDPEGIEGAGLRLGEVALAALGRLEEPRPETTTR